jgi:hypothetical protein
MCMIRTGLKYITIVLRELANGGYRLRGKLHSLIGFNYKRFNNCCQ